MELTDVQKLGLYSVILAFTQHEDFADIAKLDIKASEAARLQVKLIEFIEEHGEESEKLLEQAFTEASRALYNDIVRKDD